MRFIAPWMVLLLVATFGSVIRAGDALDGMPTMMVPAGTTFRFSDDVPDFKPAETSTEGMSVGSSDCGCSGCCQCYGGCDDRLLGVFAPSDRCFTEFISPITNPVYFENPRTLTEARLLFLHHRIPLTALGGKADVLALQVRAALTDRLSVIATKDGFISSSNPVVEDGWADINAGLKYNLWSNPSLQRLLSVGVTYELPVGSTRTLQGNGDGLFDLFVTGGMRIGNWHVISASGLLLPVDRSAESSLWFWSNHLSRPIGQTNWHVLAELNWFHWLSSGNNGFPLPVEGLDLFNFGANGVAGNDIVTGAFGFRYKPSDRLELGMAWEAPLTERRDIIDNRLTVDCILRY